MKRRCFHVQTRKFGEPPQEDIAYEFNHTIRLMSDHCIELLSFGTMTKQNRRWNKPKRIGRWKEHYYSESRSAALTFLLCSQRYLVKDVARIIAKMIYHSDLEVCWDGWSRIVGILLQERTESTIK